MLHLSALAILPSVLRDIKAISSPCSRPIQESCARVLEKYVSKLFADLDNPLASLIKVSSTEMGIYCIFSSAKLRAMETGVSEKTFSAHSAEVYAMLYSKWKTKMIIFMSF